MACEGYEALLTSHGAFFGGPLNEQLGEKFLLFLLFFFSDARFRYDTVVVDAVGGNDILLSPGSFLWCCLVLASNPNILLAPPITFCHCCCLVCCLRFQDCNGFPRGTRVQHLRGRKCSCTKFGWRCFHQFFLGSLHPKVLDSRPVGADCLATSN